MEASKTVVAEYIRRWRIARLSADTQGLGYPRINILIKALMGRGGRNIDPTDDELSDADRVQRIVNRMPPELKTVFEAYHICLIRGQRCIDLPHAARALTLGMSKQTYYKRKDTGIAFVADWLGYELDR